MGSNIAKSLWSLDCSNCYGVLFLFSAPRACVCFLLYSPAELCLMVEVEREESEEACCLYKSTQTPKHKTHTYAYHCGLVFVRVCGLCVYTFIRKWFVKGERKNEVLALEMRMCQIIWHVKELHHYDFSSWVKQLKQCYQNQKYQQD